MSWRHYASCRSEDPETFFPNGNDEVAARQIEQAKAICAGCGVRSVCLEYAVLSGIQYGVWGGCSEDERRTLSLKRGVSRTGGSETLSL
jgi:WhiB family redox-sensing transcriptional regulator